MKVLEYQIITRTWEYEVIKSVNKEIKEGWMPLGGVAVTDSISEHPHHRSVSQALIKLA